MPDKGTIIGEEELKAPVVNRNTHILAIAIDAYQHYPALHNCVRDTERIIELLTQKYQFSTAHVHKLYNDDAREANIVQALKKLVREVAPEDVVLILYSGHGAFEKDIEEGYWIPVDAQKSDASDYLPNSIIVKYLRHVKAHHLLLLVDSCFSGALFTHKAIEEAASLRLDQIASRWLFTSGRNELVSDGQPGQHSPFADNLIYFLENNQQPYLSITSLIEQVTKAVVHNARQTPRGEPLTDVGHRGGQFHFYLKEWTTTTTIDSNLYRETGNASPLTPIPKHPQPYWKYGMVLAALGVLLGLFLWMNPKKASSNQESELVQEEQPPAEEKKLDSISIPVEPKSEAVKTADQWYETSLEYAQKGLCNEAQGAYEEFDRLSSSNKSDQHLKKCRETANWQQALSQNTETGYRSYLKIYPAGVYSGAAKQRIAALFAYQLDFTFNINNSKELIVSVSKGKSPYSLELSRKGVRTENHRFENSPSPPIALAAFIGKGEGLLTITVKDANFKSHALKTFLPE
ncbi:MAG TPA: caspase family protein [Saprospiraceae bacterium]|nr:caspase family protein [Saprospiraceae bacterium]HMQ82073.1 caspase family protein [Saprospiraceae bacterium]